MQPSKSREGAWLQDFFEESHPINATQISPCDCQAILIHLERSFPASSIFYWHPKRPYLQRWQEASIECLEMPASTLFDAIEAVPSQGILVCNILDDFSGEYLEKILADLHFQLTAEKRSRRLLVVGHCKKIPNSLRSLVPWLDWTALGASLVREAIASLQARYPPKNHSRLQLACQGLSPGEVRETILRQPAARPLTEILAFINSYKTRKLLGGGVELLPAPDVPDIGGADLLRQDFNDIAKLFLPEAAAANLRPPKAAMFVGLPGTGKTLMAKLASQVCGVPLLTTSLSLLRRETAEASIDNIERVFERVGALGSAILFIDELDKGLGQWEEDFVLAKMAERLLVWAENHVEPVCLLAAVNRLEKLPAELLARFEYAWFFDLPHLGALYEIFCLQLRAWNLEFEPGDWPETDWHSLLEGYRGCVGREVAQAVKRVRRARYCRGERNRVIPIEELLDERRRFRAASQDPAIADQIANMRAKSRGLRPVCSRDTSPFARKGRSYLTVFNSESDDAENIA